MTDITLTLPDELVQQAQADGLLTTTKLSELLEAELQKREQERSRFFELMDEISLNSGLTPEEIEAEIRAYQEEMTGKD